MLDAEYVYIDLPSDAKDLTRELALQVFEHPEVFLQAYARLVTQQPHSTSQATPVRSRAANGR